MYVCLSGCHTNQIIRLEDEKVNLIENSILKNNWFLKNFTESGQFFYKVGFVEGGGLFFINMYLLFVNFVK